MGWYRQCSVFWPVTEITLPRPQLKFSLEDFVALELQPFKIIALFFRALDGVISLIFMVAVSLPASSNLVIFYSGIVHEKYCVL